MLSSDEECDSYEGLETFSLPKQKIEAPIEESMNAWTLLSEIMMRPKKFSSKQLLAYGLKRLDDEEAVVPILRFIDYTHHHFFRFCFTQCKDDILIRKLICIMNKYDFTMCADGIRLSLIDSCFNLDRFMFLFEMFPDECKACVKVVVKTYIWSVLPEILEYLFENKYVDPKNEIYVGGCFYSLFNWALEKDAPVKTLVSLYKNDAVYNFSFSKLITALSAKRNIDNTKRTEILTAFVPLFIHKQCNNSFATNVHYLFEWVRAALKPFSTEVTGDIVHDVIRFGVVLNKGLDAGIDLPVIIDSNCWVEEHEYDFCEAISDYDVSNHLSCSTLKFCLTEQEIINQIKIKK